MSRVDEAMRRAAQVTDEADVMPEAVERSLGAGAVGIQGLANEVFPSEVPASRAARAALHLAAPSLHVAQAAPSPVALEAAPPVALEPAPRPSALFERIDGALAEKVVIDSHMKATSREQYRRLAAALHRAQASRPLKVIMIASAVPGEGKTLTAANLALTFSESYRRHVLLVDGDLRRPTLHAVFRLDNSSGLSEGLVNKEDKLPVRQISETLAVLPAGKPNTDPMAGLASERMRHLIDEARTLFDWIIIDTPPVALLPDASLLASMVDGAVLVVRAGTTPYHLVQRAIEAVGRERILGTVLNSADTPSRGNHYGYYDGYYSAEPPKT